MTALYNESDPFAAAWLRNLIADGHIAPGVVDERSIEDLTPADVAGPGQRHFFAGIGGWSHALRLAGIDDTADVWTGSCPCQPFSSAGKRSGTRDPRHLWPAWFALIRECRPPAIFGEQVASPDGLAWLDLVFADLERCGYAVGAADLCAAGIGAPHIRQRHYFVAYASGERRDGERLRVQPRQSRSSGSETRGRGQARQGGMADGDESRSQGRRIDRNGGGERAARSSGMGSHWRDATWIDCADGKRRPNPTEPALFPLAHGVPNRVGLLRGAGNAIVPELAATFITAAEQVRKESE